MSDRTDLVVTLLGSEVELTGKVMPNGEIRRRVRMGDIALHMTTTVEGGWQEAHFHKGLRETYTVVKGQMVLVTRGPPGRPSRAIEMVLPSQSVTTELENQHNVYLYPGTTIVTVVYGDPVGNPDKKGNDWWPASEAFNSWTKSLVVEDLERLGLRRM